MKQYRKFYEDLGYTGAEDKVYVADPLGRIGQGNYVKKREPFGQISKKQKPERFDFTNPFSLSSPVGMNGTNHRNDVAKVEGLLGIDKTYDIKKTDGPTGYFGTRLNGAIRKFQKRHALKVDGSINPNGETVHALQRKTVSRFIKMADNGGGDKPAPGNKPADAPGNKPANPSAGNGGNSAGGGGNNEWQGEKPDQTGWLQDIFTSISSWISDAQGEGPYSGPYIGGTRW